MVVPRRVALVVAGTVAMAVPGAASADVGVVVVPAKAGPVDAATVEAALGRALDGAGLVVRAQALAAARAALRDGAVAIDELAGFARVRELIEEGWRAYLEVQTEFAVARLGEARRQCEALLPLDGGVVAYAEAALRLGAALDNAGRDGEAGDVLRLAAQLDPGRAVTVQEFSPDVVAAHAAARDAARASRSVRVVVRDADDREVAGAIVEIDGRPAMASPASLELEVGQHVVVGRAGDGFVARARTFSLAADDGAGTEQVAVVIDVDGRAAALTDGPAAGQSEAVAARWVEASLIYAELDGVVLASSTWRSARPALLVQWCDGDGAGVASCTAVVEIGYEDGELDAAARAAVDDVLEARDGRRYPPTLPGDPRIQRDDTPIKGGGGDHCRWCRPALWVGAGIAVAAVTTIVIVLATGEDQGTVVGLDPDDFVE